MPPGIDRNALLEVAYAQGQAALRRVALPFSSFAAAAERRAVSDADLLANAADFLLAVACCAGDPAALSVFEAKCMPRVADYVARLRLAPEEVDEVRQLVRIRMLADPGRKLEQYRGRGPLDAWIRIVAMRAALDHVDRRRPDEVRRAPSSVLDQLVDRGEVGEWRQLRAVYGPQIQAAFEQSFIGLAPRDKTLLKLSFVDGLSIDAIGELYRVHRATVARWLVAIRQQILDDLQRAVSLNVRSSSSEARSLIEFVRGDVRLSVERLLAVPKSLDDEARAK